MIKNVNNIFPLFHPTLTQAVQPGENHIFTLSVSGAERAAVGAPPRASSPARGGWRMRAQMSKVFGVRASRGQV